MVEVLSSKPSELPEYLADKLVAFGQWMTKEDVLYKLRYWAIPLKNIYYVLDRDAPLIVAIGRTPDEAEHSAKKYFAWKKQKEDALRKIQTDLRRSLDALLRSWRTTYRGLLSEEELTAAIQPIIDEFQSKLLYHG
ncbi:MAG: hypothetical protein QXZ68_04985 [Candidatus Bathyarchaeia archaeon]